MSLLDRGRETVVIFPEITTTDEDGNVMTRASETGISAKAAVQLISTPSQDQDGSGYTFNTANTYRMRLTRAEDQRVGRIGSQAQVEWNGQRYSIMGDPIIYEGNSRRTRHVDYVITRN